MKAIIWYREDSLTYEAMNYHLPVEKMDWVYQHTGGVLPKKKAVLSELVNQRALLFQFLVANGFEVEEFPSSVLNLAADSAPVLNALRRELDQASLVIALGGDGTFLHASSLLEHGSTSLLVGINSNPLPQGEKAGGTKAGSFGGLLWPSLSSFLTHFKTCISVATEEWTRIEVLMKDERVGLAMGEVFIGAVKNSHASHYSLSVVSAQDPSSSSPENQGSSGVIVYTGAGSGPGSWAGNAYGNGCAEFPQDAGEIRYVVREPFGGRAKVCDVQSSFRPLEPHQMLGGIIKSGEELHIVSHHLRPAYVSLDANEAIGEFPFPNQEKVILRPLLASIKVIAPRGI